jgi:adenylate kinase
VYHIKYNPPKTTNHCDRCGAELIHRKDDSEEVITSRLETYNNQTKPLIHFYEQQNKLRNIIGKGGIDKIFEAITKVLDDL